MNSQQFNTRISPDLKDRYNGFMERYKQEGRIAAKGDFFGICLDDHIWNEKRRIFQKHCDPGVKEGLDYLERLNELFERLQVNHNNEISMLTRQFNDQLLAKDIRIHDLEQKNAHLKEQLQEKTVENEDLRKGLGRMQRKKDNKGAAV